MRNAFEVLAAGVKVNNNKASRTPADGKGTYIACPLCQRTVPLSFADAHVSVCLTTPQPTPRGQSLSQPRGSSSLPSPGLGNTTPHAQIQPHLLMTPEARFTPVPSAVMPQPLQQHQQQPSLHQPHQSLQLTQQQDSQHQQSLLPQHHQNQQPKQFWEGQGKLLYDAGDVTEPQNYPPETVEPTTAERGKLAVATPLTTTAATVTTVATAIEQDINYDEQLSGQQTLHAKDLTTQSATQLPRPHCTQLPGPRCSQVAGVSAFDIMRLSQLRAASRCHTFFLERTAQGSWLGHCWAKGCATPAQQRLAGGSCWSVTLTVGSAGSRVAGGGGAAAGKETVLLLTNVPSGDGGVVSWSSAGLPSNDLPPEGRWRGGPSALKSALQKAVRLGRGSCAVRAALHLFKEDGGAAQLLRRLSIVCVEDAILHPGLPFVVWLMAAQAKGFVLGRTHLDALLCLVYQLAMVQVRDGLPDPWNDGDSATVGIPVDATSQGPATLQQVDELALPAAETCLLKCLLFRASYGGMGGDVRMMRAFAGYWAARFKGSAAPPPPLSAAITAFPLPSPEHRHRPWSGTSTTAVLSPSLGVAAIAQPPGPVASGPNNPHPISRPVTEPLPQAPCATGPSADIEAHHAPVGMDWGPSADGGVSPAPMGVAFCSPRRREAGSAEGSREEGRGLHVSEPFNSGSGSHHPLAHQARLPSEQVCRTSKLVSFATGSTAEAAEALGFSADAKHGPRAREGSDDGGTAGQHGHHFSEGTHPIDGTPVAGRACKRAATQAFGGTDSTPICTSQITPSGGSFALPGDGPCESSVAPGFLSQQLRRRSGAGMALSGGTQANWAGASQLSPADLRVSDAYFAAKLQAEDAPPSCGAFVPASQLLAEAANEQCSLQRMAATAHRQQWQSQSQAQSQQWPHPHLVPPAYPPAPTQSWHVEAANASGGNCRSSHGHMRGGEGPTGPAWHGHASQLQQQDVVLPKWYSSHGRDCAAAAKVRAARGDGGSDAGPGAGFIVPIDGDKGEYSSWLTYLCNLYDQVTVPVALAMTSSVGPMRRSDVPLSAVDFHISDIVTRLMERSEVVALAPGASGEHAATPEDAEDALKSAMWLFRSSKNPKVWVHRLSACCQHLHASEGAVAGTGSRACAEHRSLELQLDKEEASRRRLAALWSAAAPWADRFSVSYIARRFRPP
ncbi:hypothetical protein Vretifemale_13904 [Volvox reticuliferus]|uniref:UBZ4-type domain-containing protein n=1 Tax=Volvox reticuliferus TaxID=1737510 RepID=A0A8J4CNJ9_9CHLO|nr:hypothetical protein Vretifemale_13904 [Volvox reticuliferus]